MSKKAKGKKTKEKVKKYEQLEIRIVFVNNFYIISNLHLLQILNAFASFSDIQKKVVFPVAIILRFNSFEIRKKFKIEVP